MLISLSSFREGWALKRVSFCFAFMGDELPAADSDFDTDSVSTADTRDSGISIIDDFWCVLQPPIVCELLTLLQPATISALGASSLDYSESLQLALLWLAVRIVSDFFLLAGRHV